MAIAVLVFFPPAVNALLNTVNGPVGQEVHRRAVFVESAAKQYVAVDTGRLRSSIATEITQDSQGVVAFVGSNLPYAAPQEFGTYKMAAHPYLLPALQRLPR